MTQSDLLHDRTDLLLCGDIIFDIAAPVSANGQDTVAPVPFDMLPPLADSTVDCAPAPAAMIDAYIYGGGWQHLPITQEDEATFGDSEGIGDLIGTRRSQVKTAWTQEEDRLIAQGVETFGHKWSRIADELPTRRTDDAVRNRWQRLQRKEARRVRPSAAPSEATASTPATSKSTAGSAARAVAAAVAAASSEQPRTSAYGRQLKRKQRSDEVAGEEAVAAATAAITEPAPSAATAAGVLPLEDASNKHGDMWTVEEDRIIDVGIQVQGLRWKAIADMLPGRTESGCRNRWVRNQERALAAAGTPVHGAAAVFAALKSRQSQTLCMQPSVVSF